jgi:hypothetical protein
MSLKEIIFNRRNIRKIIRNRVNILCSLYYHDHPELVKTSCEICSNIKEVSKHHGDYSKPLEVSFLCRVCHTKEHIKIRTEDLDPYRNTEGKSVYYLGRWDWRF